MANTKQIVRLYIYEDKYLFRVNLYTFTHVDQ